MMTETDTNTLIDGLTQDEQRLLWMLLTERHCTRADRTEQLVARLLNTNPSAAGRLLNTLKVWKKRSEAHDEEE